ncbi:hypothetical protein FDP22_08755 [Paroceanicella profunda]|uniref:Uncharacterized protein n=1 Tax=Paroceanicella profunda TaxID=2579971 RepID=A0A5B8FSY7_9RHOB|nr:hypothetical protein [Paroceanicella profunda]QDL91856.1 hypothetical protein FDP22_08755 [Paroceanicella profunda]
MAFVPIVSALLTPMLAVFLCYIAWQQWRLSRAALRERLFDRRLRILQCVQDALEEFQARSGLSGETARMLSDTERQAGYLFDRTIAQYIHDIRDAAQRADRHCATLLRLADADPDSPEYRVAVAELTDISQWLGRQKDEVIENFEPYLRASR